MRRLSVQLLTGLIVLPTVVGCGGTPTAPAQAEGRPAPGPVAPVRHESPIADPKTDIPIASLTADEFAFQASRDQFYSFVRRHIQQVVEVSGRVETVTTRANGGVVVHLIGQLADGKKLEYVVTEPTPLPQLQPGQAVALRGVVRGGTLVPTWRLHKVSGDSPQTLTASDFLKEYEAAEDATKAKREGKFFILTGEIGQIDLPNPEAKVCTLRLKAGAGTVAAVFSNVEKAERARNAEFKVGASVKVVGECELGTPRLVRCSIIAE